MTKVRVTASAYQNGEETVFEAKGQIARALLALVEASDSGCTALDVSTWAFRFAAYCHDLRHRYGLSIRTDREEHRDGWHGRHVLETPVRVLRVEENPDPTKHPALVGGRP